MNFQNKMIDAMSTASCAGPASLLAVSCESRLGTVAAISKFLAGNGCTVVGMQQIHNVLSKRVMIRATFRLDPDRSASLAQLRMQFVEVAAQENRIEWKIERHNCELRALLLAPASESCLHDLLYRRRVGGLNLEITAIASDQPGLKEVAARNNLPYLHLPPAPHAMAQQEEELLKFLAQTKSDVMLLPRHIEVYSDDLCGQANVCAIDLTDFLTPRAKGPRPYHLAHSQVLRSEGRVGRHIGSDATEGSLLKHLANRLDDVCAIGRTAAGARRRVA